MTHENMISMLLVEINTNELATKLNVVEVWYLKKR